MSISILINEFFPDPVGPDLGWEWLEIVNIGDTEIEISGWRIQVGGVSYNNAFTFPEGSKISPNEYILICEEFVENCNYYTSRLAMQNGINKTDGVRILNDSDQVVNTVLYSRPNRNELKNDLDEIEKDSNIIEMPGDGYSFARRDFLNTGYSIQDFFISSNPTPGEENILEEAPIVISEVGENFVEFFSKGIPSNISNWYLKKGGSEEKIFLENNFKNNFFFLETPEPFKNISLYSPDDVHFDNFSVEKISPNFTYCRLNSEVEEDFTYCEETKGGKNSLKEWNPIDLVEVMDMGNDIPHIVKVCTAYKYDKLYIISDSTAAIAIECEGCNEEMCFTGEITSLLEIDILEEKTFENIPMEIAKKENYISLLNNLAVVQGNISHSNTNYSFLKTEFGTIKLKKNDLSLGHHYIFKGILNKDSNMDLILEYPVKIEELEKYNEHELERTGDPLIFLTFFFLLPFLLSKIFVKLTTINNFKRKS